MYCAYCGKKLPENAVACPKCGRPVDVHKEVAPAEESIEAPVREEPIETPVETPVAETPRLEKRPLSALLPENPNLFVGLLLAGISFVAGIILFSIALASVLPTYIGLDFLVLLPALGGLVLNIYAFYKARREENGKEKLLSLIGIGVAAFVLLFAFIACCVLIG